MLSILIFMFPSLYGEGYDTIHMLLNGTSAADWDKVMDNSIFYGYGNLLLVYLAFVVLFKVFATSATHSSIYKLLAVGGISRNASEVTIVFANILRSATGTTSFLFYSLTDPSNA